jgi:hypothetical protein
VWCTGARQPEFDRTVVIKVVLAGTVGAVAGERFRREASAMGRLSGHPNIVDVHAAGFTARGHPYLVMPFLASGSLGDRVERTGRLHWSEAVPIAVKVGGALSAAHAAGMVHRDVKPDNILFTSFGEPQLGNFGIARVVGRGADRQRRHHRDDPVRRARGLGRTATEPVLGPVLPGRDDRHRAVGPCAVPTRHRRVDGAADGADRHRAGVVLRCPDVPDAVWAVIERALAKDPARRQPDLARFFRELQGAQRTLRVPVTSVPGLAGEAIDPHETVTGASLPELDQRTARPRERPADHTPVMLAAVAAAVGYLETHAGFCRRRHGGAERVAVGGFVAAAFRHRTSRAGDPAAAHPRAGRQPRPGGR